MTNDTVNQRVHVIVSVGVAIVVVKAAVIGLDRFSNSRNVDHRRKHSVVALYATNMTNTHGS